MAVGRMRGGEEKGSCQTGVADPMQRGNIRKALAHFPVKKERGREREREKVLQQQPRRTKSRAVRSAHRLPKMSSAEATPDSMVVVQHKDSNCSIKIINNQHIAVIIIN